MTREARGMRRAIVGAPDRHHVPVPHSSWTRREPAPGPARRLDADDFWARLGL